MNCGAGNPSLIFVLRQEGTPPGEPEHNITYAHTMIAACSACGHALIETLAHDCFDFDEVWDQYEWYDLGVHDTRQVAALASQCNRPLDPACTCPIHEALRAACERLPASYWASSLEAEKHVHRVVLDRQAPGTIALRLL